VLGVERSVKGRAWRSRLSDERISLALAQQLELPEPVCRLLAARGIGPEQAKGFLNPTLRAQLPDPADFLDMEKAAARLSVAIAAGEPIGIFGDYDVDGATASAVLVRFLRSIGVRTTIHIPDRAREGYGPNTLGLTRLKAAGARVVVTVDCGISAFEPLAVAAADGLDVIVVDHHLAEARLPIAHAVINPNRLDETVPHRQLAAVGVAYLLVIALNRRLRKAGWYERRAEPDLLSLLDLVALGTVCDVVPLTGLNRALVCQGLKVMARRANVGLAALGDLAKLDGPPTTYHLGYVLGPRVNAGGRVGAPALGVTLLTTEDADEAAALAAKLDLHNRERQAIESAVLEAAIEQIEARGDARAPLTIAAGLGWHIGVIGIVASRLVERFERPAVVIGLGDGVGKGSGRSIAGVDLGSAITAARQAGLLVNGGGHAMAAGFTVAEERCTELCAFLSERLSGSIAGQLGETRPLLFDGTLLPEGATPELIALIERAGPFGAGNPEPRFALANARVVRADVVGNGHVRCIALGPQGGRLKGIAFRAADEPLGLALLKSRGGLIHLAGRLKLDRWQNREEVQLVIDDLAYAHGQDGAANP
jgi:single-stranded-DNA-specific exonuclease